MIPKIIHQVWEGATEPVMPKRLKILSKTWREKNPTWEYRLWNQADMEQLVEYDFPDFKETYFRFKQSVLRWDAIRYMILYKHGGFYADLDTECLEPFDKMLENKKCCFGEEPPEHSAVFSVNNLFGNAFMAAVPKLDIFLLILNEIKCSLGKYNTHVVLNTTGPLMITRVLNKYDFAEKKINILPYLEVSPLTKSEVIRLLEGNATDEIADKLENAYCVHYYFGSWDRNFSVFV